MVILLIINDNAHVSDDEYENVDMDHNFPKNLSRHLTLTPSIKNSDCQHSPTWI